jgi:hypothetical protein
MNSDIQTTVAGVITGVGALVSIIAAGGWSKWSLISGIATGLASAWLGWKSNKK